MKKNEEFDNILDECLERLLVKGETVEDCLISYPQQADELKPLLQTALATKQASAIQPRPEFRAKARYEFRSALHEIESKKSRGLFSWQRRWVTAVTAVLILLLIGSGTVAAAGNSMPGQFLHPVKLATEQVQLTLTFSALGKAELYAQLADRRVTEIIYAANKGNAEQTKQATQRLDTCLMMIVSLAGAQTEETDLLRTPAPALAPTPTPAPAPTPAPTEPSQKAAESDAGTYAPTGGESELETTLAGYAVEHQAELQAALQTAPEATKSALRQAIAVSVTGYEQALQAFKARKGQ